MFLSEIPGMSNRRVSEDAGRGAGLLVTGSASGSRVWGTKPAHVATICQALKAPVRWQDYLPGIPYSTVCGSRSLAVMS